MEGTRNDQIGKIISIYGCISLFWILLFYIFLCEKI
jgi:hypothetical protein